MAPSKDGYTAKDVLYHAKDLAVYPLAELDEEREYSYADFGEYAYRYSLCLEATHDDWFYKGLARAKQIVRNGVIK